MSTKTLRELKDDLHYHQQMNIVAARALKAGRKKCKAIAVEMRALQSSTIKRKRTK